MISAKVKNRWKFPANIFLIHKNAVVDYMPCDEPSQSCPSTFQDRSYWAMLLVNNLIQNDIIKSVTEQLFIYSR